MDIKKVSGVEVYNKVNENQKLSNEKVEKTKVEEMKKNQSGLVYDKLTISELKAESDRAYEGLRKIVEDMLKRQGYSFIEIKNIDEKDIVVDEIAAKQAKAAIEGEGPYSPESVSDRIVKFAKAISGGDKSKMDLIKSAIEKGFKAAEEVFGELPDISSKTHEMVMEKLEKWENEE